MNKHTRFGLLLTLIVACACHTAASEVLDDVRYSTSKPADDWAALGFDDQAWQQGQAGFGNFGVGDGVGRVNTEWLTQEIWFRKQVTLDGELSNPALLIYHDDDAEVYLNGVMAAKFSAASPGYIVRKLEGAALKSLRAGKNVLAVHCRNTGGEQYIDVHLVNSQQLPKLPPGKRLEHPFESDQITRWGAEITPENAWSEYPRPQLKRDQWQNLNGKWGYAITPSTQQQAPQDWDGQVLVPFSLESKLGGVQRLLHPDQALWYHLAFTPEGAGERTLLNFEAVDYRCQVYVNGSRVGGHQGGNLPFTIDITDALREGSNDLVLRVEDATGDWQLRGKQTRYPQGIRYTRVSGIWQTVWLERVSASHLSDLTLGSDAQAGAITCRADVAGTGGASVLVVARDNGGEVARTQGKPGDQLTLPIPHAKLWSPDSPHLYDLEVTLSDASGKVLDRVASYAGIRQVGKRRDKNGHWRFTLNGEEIFHWGPLDQGWWP
ncbi:MAG: glycoside hydrolase family 2, partial [Planctomycetales bacterium]|nr:glycoside hydrolase family 2 [Planctomycetales bacterium]